MTVRTFPYGVELFEDTYIDLICEPNITDAIDTEVDIFVSWTACRSNGESIYIGGEDYTITNDSDSSTLRIERLTMDRDDMALYHCLVNVTPSSESDYVIGSAPSMGGITLDVNGKLSRNYESCSMLY